MLDPIQFIRSRPEMYLPGGRVDPRFLATQMANDALILGAGRTIAVHHGDLWGVAADVDWLAGAPVSVAELFRRIVPFPQAGDNGMRSEVLIGAFADFAMTWCGDDSIAIKGDHVETSEIRRTLDGSWKRAIVFRVEPDRLATPAVAVAAARD